MTARMGCILLIVATLGCSTGDHPPVYSAKGTITFQGKAVDGAEVIFLPLSESAEESSSGRATTDSSGNYSLKTFFSADVDVTGARPGNYRVTVTKIEAPTGIVDPFQPESKLKHLLPEKYSSAVTTPLRAEVQAQSNRFDFELQD